MILAVDVQYSEDKGYVGAVSFDTFTDKEPTSEYVTVCDNVAEYEAGSFYKRELPCILKLLNDHKLKPEIIVIDGYVYLDEEQKVQGLGAHLYNAIYWNVVIIGVAKKRFHTVPESFGVLRGNSNKPLYVTSTSDIEFAASMVRGMHGEYRIPTLLKAADSLCRQYALHDFTRRM